MTHLVTIVGSHNQINRQMQFVDHILTLLIMKLLLSMQLPRNQFNDTHFTSNVKSLFAGISGCFFDP